MKSLLIFGCCLAMCGCEKEAVPATPDPLEAQRAFNDLSGAVIEAELRKFESSHEKTSAHAATEYRLAAERMEKAKERAKAAGMSDLEIDLKILAARRKAGEEVNKRLGISSTSHPEP